MCRIAGLISPQLPVSSLKSLVKEMCDILKNGGPDDEGIYCAEEKHLVFGNRRLALLDLTQSGHQPMAYAEGKYHITYNGEIYNYRELKSELKSLGCNFRTECDTEVILAAFAQWGTQSFEKLSGMFAIALHDTIENCVFLARDGAGIKPLYYANTKEGLAFASEVKAFKPVPWLQEENPSWKVYMMAYGHLPEPVTTLKEVQPLKKGTFLRYDLQSGETSIKVFNQLIFRDNIVSKSEALAKINEKLTTAVHRHLIADAPVGIFLSGGLDSGILALLAHQTEKSQIKTLSLFFEDKNYSEKKYQQILLDKMRCESSQHLLTENDFHVHLPRILDDMDQPSSDGINTWFISKFAKEEGLKAVLSGIGADELFGGYPSFQRMEKVKMLEMLPKSFLKAGKYTGLKQLRRLGYLGIEGATGKYLFLRGQFVPVDIAKQLNIDESQVWRLLQEKPVRERLRRLSSGNQASWIETNMYMQNQLLRDADVMSMAHGVEIRVPFLDKDFLNLAININSEIKYRGPHPKQILIDTFKDIIPDQIYNRPKMGFQFPFKKWFARDEYAKSMMMADPKNYKEFISGRMHWSQFMTLLLIQKRANG